MVGEPSVEIRLTQLAEALSVLIDHIRAISGKDSIVLADDYFWSIPVMEMNDFASDSPPTPTIGQISETWDNIESMIADDQVISYGLTWLADIFRAMSKELVG